MKRRKNRKVKIEKLNTNKAELLREYEIRKNRMIAMCKQLDIYYREFYSKSFRLIKNEKVIDYFPYSNKCYWHSDSAWGLVENVTAFLRFEFQN